MPRKHGEFASVREAIVVTASDLFTKQGVHGTSLGDIAQQADLSKGTLRTVLSSAIRLDDRMTERVAAELRHWLIEPTFSSEQRDPLAKRMTPRQRSLALNEDKVRFRRIKGPAGSGKSLVIAGRAAELATSGKRVLVVTFNITLINYLVDLSVRYAQAGAVRNQITALNFHYWCKRVASNAGRDDEYDALWSEINPEDEEAAKTVLDVTLPRAAAQWAASLDDEDRWDAILVDDEGIILIDQDADRDGVARWALAYCAHALATHPS